MITFEDLFEPLNNNDNPIREVTVKGEGFDSVVTEAAKGTFSLSQFTAYLEDKLIFVTPDCCLLDDYTDVPDAYEDYVLDVVIVTAAGEASKKYLVKIAGSNVDAATTAFSGVLRLISEFAKSENSGWDVTIKCFASQPRQPLPILMLSGAEHALSCLRLHFCAVDATTIATLLSSFGRKEVELRQCSIGAGLGDALMSDQGGPEKLIVSCTMPEFASSATGLGKSPTVKELDLLLHFWLQGEPFNHFCETLATNTRLKRVRMKYLDVSDDGWMALFKALQKNTTLETLEMMFTDNFVDDYRRLTPERRKARTDAVLECLRQNMTLKEVTWPDFQKDESVKKEIEAILEERNS